MLSDNQTTLPLPAEDKIQPQYSLLVSQVASTLTRTFPTLIDSLYLYGSVARGQAIAGVSDLDMTVIFRRSASAAEQQQLDAVRQSLANSTLLVTKIDFDCGVRSEVLAPQNQLSWGYWLKHHCLCIYGDDLRQNFQPFAPSKAIALAVNRDFLSVVSHFLSLARNSHSPLERGNQQRAAARKLLRATDILRREEDRDWSGSLQAYADKMIVRYPAMARDTRKLLALCLKADESTPVERTLIEQYAAWLEKMFERGD